MDRSYDSIPRQGEHHGRDLHEEPTTNVRAQEAVKPRPEDEGGGIILRSYSEGERRYRIRRWQSRAYAAPAEGYEELNRLPEDTAAEALREGIPEKARFIVFENSATGEMYFDREGELSGDWTAEGRFDQITLFDDEGAAAEYAAARRNSE